MRLLTIGYEGATVGSLLETLTRSGVDLVADVRAVTASRRPGFSKRNLSAELEQHGVGYIHLRGLGTPSEGRTAARRGDFAGMYRIYEEQLKRPEAEADLLVLAELIASGKSVCLMCYEQSHDHCHRRRIAELMQKRLGVGADHLVPPPAAL